MFRSVRKAGVWSLKAGDTKQENKGSGSNKTEQTTQKLIPRTLEAIKAESPFTIQPHFNEFLFYLGSFHI